MRRKSFPLKFTPDLFKIVIALAAAFHVFGSYLEASIISNRTCLNSSSICTLSAKNRNASESSNKQQLFKSLPDMTQPNNNEPLNKCRAAKKAIRDKCKNA